MSSRASERTSPKSSRSGTVPSGRTLFLAAGGVLALVYGAVLGVPLIWEDLGVIVFNGAFEGTIPLSSFFSSDYFAFSGEHTWRPLTTFSYYALISLGAKSPWFLRLAGLLLHAANGALLMRLLRSLGFKPLAAAAAGALFLIHPAHSETLLTVAFNEELLAAFGLLVFLNAHQAGRPALAAVGLVWSLLAKEIGLAALPLGLLMDWAQRRRFRGLRLRAHCLYGGLGAIFLWVFFGPLSGPGAGMSPSLPAGDRLFFALTSVATALRVILLPAGLRIEYFAILPVSEALFALSLLGLIFFLALIAEAGRRLWRRDRMHFFFFAWGFLFLGATSNIIPVGVLGTRLMAERWLYLPLLGLIPALVLAVGKRGRVLVGIAVLWSVLGLMRVQDWKSEVRLWSSLARVYPWCAKAHEGLGAAYYREGRFDEAIIALESARDVRQSRADRVLSYYVPRSGGQLRWDSGSLHRWLGLAYLGAGQREQARQDLIRATEIEPGHVYPYQVLAYLDAEDGRFPSASRWAAKGLELDPENTFLRRLWPDIRASRLSFQAAFDYGFSR